MHVCSKLSDELSDCSLSGIALPFVTAVVRFPCFSVEEHALLVGAPLLAICAFGPESVYFPRLAELASCPAVARSLSLVMHECLRAFLKAEQHSCPTRLVLPRAACSCEQAFSNARSRSSATG